jgi:hypothetical protein
MSKIHISRNRQSLGHFFPGEVAVGLRTGRFLPTDLAWQDPMETWKPLAEFTDLPAVDAEPEGPPPLPEASAAAPMASEQQGEPAWERRQSEGNVAAFFKTIGQVFSQPTTTFRGLKPQAAVGPALAYFILLATCATWVFLAYQLAFVLMVPDLVKAQFGDKVSMSMVVAGTVFNMLFAPFFLAGLALAFSGVLHVLLTLFGATQPVFAVTMRAFCYAVGTSYLLLLIPMCGPFAFVPCAVIFLVIALKAAHGIDAFRTLAAVMIPVLLLAVGYGLLLAQAGMIK